MSARGSQRIIHLRGYYAIHPKLFRNLAELSNVVAALGEFQRWNQRIERFLTGTRAGRSSRKFGLFCQYHVDLRARAIHFYAADCIPEIIRQLASLEHA